MKWIYLIMAIIFEVCGTTTMKLSNGLSNLKFSVIMLIFYLLSLGSLSLSLKELQISMAYAIWSGVGIVLITIIGILFFKEDISLIKIICISLIGIGIVGLNLFGNTH